MIRNIVFDLGGVVIDLQRERCVQAFERLGYNGADADLGLYRQGGVFYDLEVGAITTAEFYDSLRHLCPGARFDTDIRDAFNAFLVDLPRERLAALDALKPEYRLFALSNTNAVMYHSWIDNAFRADGKSINEYFEGIIASFQEKCCKPDPEIFRILLHRYGLESMETLYIDDSEANCEAAASVGLQTRQVTADVTMIDIVKPYIQQ